MSKSHHEAKFATEARETLGSRSARALRAAGRIPASLQFEGRDGALCHFSIDEAEFAAARRSEASLFDLEIGGEVKSAVIREIQYDSMGSNVNHVDFKGVIRGQRSDVRVSISVTGTAQGTLNQSMDSVEVNCLPKDIPDAIEVQVGSLEPGTQLHAS
ncbi:MAG: 50S ribosomal protein L25, partial [Planctomycetota bacterium]|nr:50S ribosomal protein L25 [Planctomycetota bacterium]